MNNEEKLINKNKNRNIVPIVKFTDRQQLRKPSRRNYHRFSQIDVSLVDRYSSKDSIKPSSPTILNEMMNINMSRRKDSRNGNQES